MRRSEALYRPTNRLKTPPATWSAALFPAAEEPTAGESLAVSPSWLR